MRIQSITLIVFLTLMAGCAGGKSSARSDSGSDGSSSDSGDGESETASACAALADADVSEAIDAGLFLVSGESIASLTDFETTIQEYMWTYGIPNAGLAFVAGDKRLVLTRSYTNYCGGETYGSGGLVHVPETSRPDTRFRIGSVSKVITATAIIAASEAANPLLALDDQLLDYVDMDPEADFDGDGLVDTRDPRVSDITIDHLLRHRAGWNCREPDDPDLIGEPTKSDFEIQAAYSRVGSDISLPISISHIIGYGSGFPLAYEPGASKNYCGFGYMLLGEVLASATGRSPARAVRDLVFSRLDANTFEQGHTLRSESQPDELIYHHHSDGTAASVMADGEVAPLAYGGAFNLENRFATGGWLASPIDLVRLGWGFVHGELVSDPTLVVSQNMGWAEDFRRAGATGHTGSLEGSHSVLLCYAAADPDPVAAGACWSVLFNRSRPSSDEGSTEPRDVLISALASLPIGLADLGTSEDYW